MFKYSYNFKPSIVALTQDRNTVDSWELKKLTAKMISLVEDETFVKEAIESNSYDTQLITEYYYTDKELEIKQEYTYSSCKLENNVYLYYEDRSLVDFVGSYYFYRFDI